MQEAENKRLQARIAWLDVRVEMRAARLIETGKSKKLQVEARRCSRRRLVSRLGPEQAVDKVVLWRELTKAKALLAKEEEMMRDYTSATSVHALRKKLDALEMRLEQLREESGVSRSLEVLLLTLTGKTKVRCWS